MDNSWKHTLAAQLGFASNQPSVSTKVSRATWAGLAISLFAMVGIRQVIAFFVPETTFASALLKEALIWLSALALIVIIRRGELCPALHRTRHRALVEIHLVGLHHRDRVSSDRPSAGLSHRLRTRTRLGGVRETPAMVDHRDRFPRRSGGRIIYRGYAIERLQTIGVGRFWSVAIPLVIFSLGHWSGGAANILSHSQQV